MTESVYLTVECRTEVEPEKVRHLCLNTHSRCGVSEVQDNPWDLRRFGSIEEIVKESWMFQMSADRRGLGKIDWSSLVIREVRTVVRERTFMQDLSGRAGGRQ